LLLKEKTKGEGGRKRGGKTLKWSTWVDILSLLTDVDALWPHPWREPHLDAVYVSLLQPEKNFHKLSHSIQDNIVFPYSFIYFLLSAQRTHCGCMSTCMITFLNCINYLVSLSIPKYKILIAKSVSKHGMHVMKTY
jgi:hypothetical protein